ncbi:MAG: hypothetical protein LAN61_01395 [Acidobacteriia bacterium]|nr:hypothetical protein [Terriglobia bacterium]
MTKPNKPTISMILLYLAILFGGVLLVAWVLSEILSLPPKATYQLTKASLDAAAAVAVLGFAFARQRLNTKVTLIATGLLSLGLTLWVLSIGHQSPTGASTISTVDQDAYVVSTERFDENGKPVWTLAHGKQLYTINYDNTCTQQTAAADCDHALDVGQSFGGSNVSFHGDGHVISLVESKADKDLTHFYQVMRVDAVP